jgi:hypothetical protein
MKWAKLKTDPDIPFMNSNDRGRFIEEYDSILEEKKAGPLNGYKHVVGKKDKQGQHGADDFSSWIYDENGEPGYYDYPESGFGRNEMVNYEMFCAGWLRFYEDVVREGENLNHTLYFKWDHKKHRVTIWINPACVVRTNAAYKKKYADYIKYEPAVQIDPPTTPPPPPPPRTS